MSEAPTTGLNPEDLQQAENYYSVEKQLGNQASKAIRELKHDQKDYEAIDPVVKQVASQVGELVVGRGYNIAGGGKTVRTAKADAYRDVTGNEGGYPDNVRTLPDMHATRYGKVDHAIFVSNQMQSRKDTIDKRDANLWRSQQHYKQNQEAYETQALLDAQAAGKNTKFGSEK